MGELAHTAHLSCSEGYTAFEYAGTCVRFRTPRALRRYLRVREWDRGYLVADVEYDGQPAPVEEYLDLVPILENLYIDPDEFLAPIEEVECVEHAR